MQFTLDLLDDKEVFHGSPIGLQIMCRRLQEEKAIALGEIIVSALKNCKSA